MVKQWVYEDAVELYESNKVDFRFLDSQNKAHFEVEDEETHHVQIDSDLKYYCDCLFGVGKGVNGARCSHEIAVELWINLKAVKGSFNFEVFKTDRKIRDVEKKDRKELNAGQKKVLRDILTCEICGEDKIQLHRVKRQGPYQLRNLIPLCDEHHKKMHSKERGHH